LWLFLPASALAQANAGFAGQVLDRGNRSPLAGAVVTVLGKPPTLRTDSGGRVERSGLEPGTYVIQVRSLGYATRTWIVELTPRQTLTLELDLEPMPVSLRSVTVAAEPWHQRGMRGFEERRQRGRGIYLTEIEIHERRQARQLGDLLRSVPGIREICRRGICRVRMARSDCPPNFFVDGSSANNSTTLEMPVVGIIGVEIYRTSTETPPEFLRGANVCGTIVIWTRSGL
jgi:hypothetical protein